MVFSRCACKVGLDDVTTGVKFHFYVHEKRKKSSFSWRLPMSRFQEVLRTAPPITLGFIILCSALYLFQVVGDVQLHHWTLAPRFVFTQPYRIVSSALLHGGFLHLGMNMMSLYAIGAMVERRLGSFRLFFTIMASIVGTALVHVSVAWTTKLILGVSTFVMEQSIGFSGVLFHLSVLECHLGSHSNRSLFGFMEVPAKLYPFAL